MVTHEIHHRIHRIHVWYIYIYTNIGGILMVNVTIYEPWSILTIWLMVIPSIISILIMVIINPYEPLDD